MTSYTNITRVLVTGASGFVGKHLVDRLTSDGKDVVAPLRSEGFDILRDELPLDGVEHVIHLAALTGVVEAWDDPVIYHNVNTHGTVRVLDQCRRQGCSMTYVSTYVYGQPKSLPVAESAPTIANNPYGFSKLMAEKACEFYAASFNVPAVILRLFNGYGPGQSDRFLLPHIARQVASDNCTQIEVKDLRPRRDYVYISDVVDAFICAMDAHPGDIFNIGSGVSYSVEDIIKIALNVAGVDKPYGCPTQLIRKNEVDDVVADISLIEKSIGWKPKVDIADGLKRLIDSMRNQ
jgi:nucleoside-diphosphate-sugar epimerase